AAYTGIPADPPGRPKSVPQWNVPHRGPNPDVTVRPVPSGQYLMARSPTPTAGRPRGWQNIPQTRWRRVASGSTYQSSACSADSGGRDGSVHLKAAERWMNAVGVPLGVVRVGLRGGLPE